MLQVTLSICWYGSSACVYRFSLLFLFLFLEGLPLVATQLVVREWLWSRLIPVIPASWLSRAAEVLVYPIFTDTRCSALLISNVAGSLALSTHRWCHGCFLVNEWQRIFLEVQLFVFLEICVERGDFVDLAPLLGHSKFFQGCKLIEKPPILGLIHLPWTPHLTNLGSLITNMDSEIANSTMCAK